MGRKKLPSPSIFQKSCQSPPALGNLGGGKRLSPSNLQARRIIFLVIIGLIVPSFWGVNFSKTVAGNITSSPCQQPLKALIPPLLEALPSYSNRVSQRSQSDLSPLTTYVIVAGRSEWEPRPLAQRQWQPTVADTTEQVFFTTLERSYTEQRALQTQNFYWAFFVQTQRGWQLALLYQQLGGFSPRHPASPRRDASNGAIAQGIKLWLRDCRAGVFAPPSP